MRQLLDDRPIENLTLDDLRMALSQAGDEDEYWEAKAHEVRREHVSRAVASLANRDGGLFVIGAARGEDGIWTLPGARLPAEEPGLWLSQIIRGSLKPTPSVQLRVFDLDNGLYVAVVQIDAHPEHLVLISDGRVVRRGHGSTEPIVDGAELTRLVRARNGVEAPLNIDLALAPDALANAASRMIAAHGTGRLRSTITALKSQLVRAAEHKPLAELAEIGDRLTALTAVLVQDEPEGPVTRFAIDAHLQAFDAATRFSTSPARPDLDLYRVLLRNARALGGLLVRLETWALIRRLAAHSVPDDSDLYPGWMTFVGVQDARAGIRSSDSRVWQETIQESVAAAQRIGALNPDGADEHQLLDSILAFDMLANLIELDVANRAGNEGEISPDFALFRTDALKPILSRLSSDAQTRAAILPDRDVADTARLIASLNKQCRRLANNHSMFWHGA